MKHISAAALAAALASSSAAMAQDVTYKQLENHTVTASFTYAQTIRLLEQGDRIVNNENRQTMTLKLRPDNLIDQNYKVQIVTKDGRQVGGYSGDLTAQQNKPAKWQHGDMLFTFDGGSLIRLQTFATGGRKITVSFIVRPHQDRLRLQGRSPVREGGGLRRCHRHNGAGQPPENRNPLGQDGAVELPGGQDESLTGPLPALTGPARRRAGRLTSGDPAPTTRPRFGGPMAPVPRFATRGSGLSLWPKDLSVSGLPRHRGGRVSSTQVFSRGRDDQAH
jgi:hypothetical protein